MYIPVWILWVVGFAVVCCIVEDFVLRAEKEPNLRKRIEQPPSPPLPLVGNHVTAVRRGPAPCSVDGSP
jgi:hypothetical protein